MHVQLSDLYMVYSTAVGLLRLKLFILLLLQLFDLLLLQRVQDEKRGVWHDGGVL